MFDRLVPVSQPQRDRFDLVDDVSLLRRQSLVERGTQIGNEPVEGAAQVVDLVGGETVEGLLQHEAGGEQLPAGLVSVVAECGHGADRSELGLCSPWGMSQRVPMVSREGLSHGSVGSDWGSQDVCE